MVQTIWVSVEDVTAHTLLLRDTVGLLPNKVPTIVSDDPEAVAELTWGVELLR